MPMAGVVQQSAADQAPVASHLAPSIVACAFRLLIEGTLAPREGTLVGILPGAHARGCRMAAAAGTPCAEVRAVWPLQDSHSDASDSQKEQWRRHLVLCGPYLHFKHAVLQISSSSVLFR